MDRVIIVETCPPVLFYATIQQSDFKNLPKRNAGPAGFEKTAPGKLPFIPHFVMDRLNFVFSPLPRPLSSNRTPLYNSIMLFSFFRRRAMTGGLFFGPAGWQPSGWYREMPPVEPAQTLPSEPKTLAELIFALDSAQIGDCDPWTPSFLRQLKALGTGRPRALILNMLPRQPESLLAQALIKIDSPAIRHAVRVIKNALNPRESILTIDKHDHTLRRTCRDCIKGSGIKVQRLLNLYPRAHPTVLVWTLFGARLPVGGLPSLQGHLIVDPTTLWALGRYLTLGEKMTRRPVEFFSSDVLPRIGLVPLGQTLSAALDEHGIPAEHMQIIRNGMMSGEEVPPESTVTSTTESLSARPFPAVEKSNPCIECGWCVDHCPTDLNPLHLYELAQDPLRAPLAESAESLHCIGCGLCSYVCPTRLPLTPHANDLRSQVIHERDMIARLAEKERQS